MSRKAREGWREDFLEVLAETGNASLAARRAGVDKTTAYTRRHRDGAFREDWARAKETADAQVAQEGAPPRGSVRSPSPPDAEEDLVVRFSKKDGAQRVKAGPGRWSHLVEARFLSALRATGNVRAAAAAAGISKDALYYRRKRYPLLEAQWAAAREEGCRVVSLMLIDAAEAALDPAVDADSLKLPKVTVAEAMGILRIHRFEEAGAPTHAGAAAALKARGKAIEAMPIEEVRAEVMRRIRAMRAHAAREEAEREDGEAEDGEERQ